MEWATKETELKAARPSLLRVLVDAGVAPENELRVAFAEGMGSGERFGEVVLRHGWLDEAGLARALAHQWGLPYLDDAEIGQDATTLLSATVAEELGVCPISSSDGRFLVAVAEPSEERFAAVRAAAAAEPEFAVVALATLKRLLEHTAESAQEEEAAAAEARAASVAADDQSEASLHWLDRELGAATAQLVGLRERVVQLVASDQRSERELVETRAQVAQLSEAHAAAQKRIRSLEAELAREQERIAAVRTNLAEANRTLDS
jgi:type IV pilus assembly protein PilB